MKNRLESEDPVSRLSRVDLSALPVDGGERYNRLISDKSPYLLQTGEEMQRTLSRLTESAPDEQPLSDALLENAYRNYLATFDRQHAGFETAPCMRIVVAKLSSEEPCRLLN